MKRLIAGVASAALVGALLAGAPSSVFATFTTATITGVPASINWGQATQGGTEARVRIDVAGTPITWHVTGGNGRYIPTLGITFLCNQQPYGPFTGTSCSGTSANEIPRSSMKFAGTQSNCSSATSTCYTTCDNGVNPNLGQGTNNGNFVFITSSPTALGSGRVATNYAPGYPLCAASSGAAGSVGCTTCTADADTRLANFNIGVTVPAGKNSGVYQALLTFQIFTAP